MVDTRHIEAGGLRVSFEPQDESTARVIAAAAGEALAAVQVHWGLSSPSHCRLYVMTDWRAFAFQSAPWPWKISLALGYPLWARRARRTWPFSAGWTLRYGRRTAIGIKPPRLLETSDKSVGVHMYVEENDPVAKVRHLTCHELTHAASAHLRLPAWLNEGLAAVTVDRFLGRQTIRADSLALLERMRPKAPPPPYRALARLRGEELAYHCVRGYWIVRYLEEAHPGFVRSLLATPQAPAAIEPQVADRLGLPPAGLWTDIDALASAHFRGPGQAVS